MLLVLAKTHMHVDDILGGTDSIDSARTFINELQSLFDCVGF